MAKNIVYFYSSGNQKPVKKFLDKCSARAKTKILRQLKYVEEFGINRSVLNLKKLTSLDTYLNKQLKNVAFKKEWKTSEAQYQIVRQIIKARKKNNISQRQLAKKAKTTQAVISRIESLNTSPSLGLLERMAKALNTTIQIHLK